MRVDLHDGIFVVVQSFSHDHLFETPRTTAHQASLSYTISWCLLKFMSAELVMLSKYLVLCCPLLLLLQFFPASGCFPSRLQIRQLKYCSFSFNISSSNEYSGLISFKIDWFDFLAVQRTFKNFLQHHSSKTSVLWCSAFFMVKLSHPYMTTGKTIALLAK